jgi:hypothetical protein
MRLVCLHADTVDALKRLHIQLDDLTPSGLWSSQYHLVGLTPDQAGALDIFHVEVEDVTPAQLAELGGERQATQRGDSAARPQRASPADLSEERAPSRAAGVSEAEVPLAQARDGGTKGGDVKADTKADTKPDGKTTTQTAPEAPTPQAGAAQMPRGAGKSGGPQVAPPAQANRKGQATQGPSTSQRYGTTRLRISVAGKYTEATVANGKIVIGSRTFDSPDQAAAELTKSRGDWTFWEYYDSTDGKWRMLTRDWDTVLKSAAPGGR